MTDFVTRVMLAIAAVCAGVLTAGFLLFAFTKGADYYQILALAPEQARSRLAARRQSVRRRMDGVIWRVKDRKRAALFDRIMTVSGQVFEASPATARELRHLRLMVAERLTVDPNWVRLGRGRARALTGILLDPALADAPALDAARAFWEEAQSAYDEAGRARLMDPDLLRPQLLIETPPLEAFLRARRAGCRVSTAGARLGLGQPRDDCAVAPEGYGCLPTGAERVMKASRAGWQLDKIGCAELERAAAGDPLSMEDFRPNWNGERCLAAARSAVGAPGWRDSEALCAELDARAQAKGLRVIRGLR